MAVVLTAVAGTFTAFGQWPSYQSKGPRGKDGKIDVNAPPPRTADGKIDFSGLWEPARITTQANRDQDKQPVTPPGEPPVGQFFNIGVGFKEGLPFTKWAADVRADRKANNNKDNPDANCLPLGLTQLHMHPYPRKIVQTSEEIIMMYEANADKRDILLNRPLPTNDPSPWWYGYSSGHWDGDTLVIETTNFRPDLGFRGASERMKLTERFTRTGPDTMMYEFTVSDPATWTRTWTAQTPVVKNPELMYEYACHEGNYGMYGLLSGARAVDEKANAAKKGSN